MELRDAVGFKFCGTYFAGVLVKNCCLTYPGVFESVI